MIKNGFLLCTGKNIYFLESEKKNKCKSVIDDFIKGLAKKRNLCQETLERCLSDEGCRADVFDKVDKFTYELRTTENGYQYHNFMSNNCIMNFPLDDCEEVNFL